ncbi:MAG: glycosyltransferase family 4 protein [Desulfobulbaceae bacterium]|nr:glycosyltransferase family 4 protein [Desulfobulbaceae bacterium]
MINILHTIDTTGPGGAETVFVNLVKGLDAHHFKSIAVIRGPGWVCRALQGIGIEPIFVQSKGGFNFHYLLELVKIIRKHKIDLVQSHLLGSNLYCSLAGMICRVPVVSTFHGFVDSSGNDRLMSLKTRLINAGSRKIVFVSDRLREHFVLRYGFSAEKSITIYNGVDTCLFKPQRDEEIRKELGIGPEHILIGALGNIRPAKGYEYFLKAARLVYDKNPDCRFVITGEGSGLLYESLLTLRKDLGLGGVFFFLGFREDTAKLLNNLNIFLLSSISEGFSISTIEAMACKVPVVVTRSGGPEEIVSNGVNGITVDCDEHEIANGIFKLIENSDTIKYIINNSYTAVNGKFSLKKMIETYQCTYNYL